MDYEHVHSEGKTSAGSVSIEWRTSVRVRLKIKLERGAKSPVPTFDETNHRILATHHRIQRSMNPTIMTVGTESILP